MQATRKATPHLCAAKQGKRQREELARTIHWKRRVGSGPKESSSGSAVDDELTAIQCSRMDVSSLICARTRRLLTCIAPSTSTPCCGARKDGAAYSHSLAREWRDRVRHT